MQNSKTYINTLNIVYYIYIIVLIIFLAISVWFTIPEREEEFYIEYLFTDFVVIIIGIIIAFYYPHKMLLQAKLKNGLREKLYSYRKATLIRWSLIFVVSLYCIIGYLLTHKYIFICTSLFSIIIFIISKISKKIICEDLELNSKERGIIYNPNAAI